MRANEQSLHNSSEGVSVVVEMQIIVLQRLSNRRRSEERGATYASEDDVLGMAGTAVHFEKKRASLASHIVGQHRHLAFAHRRTPGVTRVFIQGVVVGGDRLAKMKRQREGHRESPGRWKKRRGGNA